MDVSNTASEHVQKALQRDPAMYIGSYYSANILRGNQSMNNIRADIQVGSRSLQYLGGVVGLVYVDLGPSLTGDKWARKTARIQTSLANSSSAGVNLQFSTWDDTALYNAGASWMKFPSELGDSFRFGQCETNIGQARFNPPFPSGSQPKVLVCLNTLDGFDLVRQNLWDMEAVKSELLSTNFNPRRKASTPGPHERFELELRGSSNIQATWIATTRDDVVIGEFQSEGTGAGIVHLEGFKQPPAIFAAIRKIYLHTSRTADEGLRVKVTTSPHPGGFCWRIDTLGNSCEWSNPTDSNVTVSYLAMESFP